MSRGFTPRRIAALEAEVREARRAAISTRSRGETRFDVQQAFSVKLPMDVISVLLGIPEADRDWYRHTVDKGLERDPETGKPGMENLAMLVKARELMLGLLADRRKQPARGPDQRDRRGRVRRSPTARARSLSDDEVAAFTTLLAAAGAETTAKLIGNMIVYLFQHPDQRRYVFEDAAARLPNAIEEVLRYDAPSQFQGRVAMRDVTVHGVTIPKGARVALVTGAACRDPREFAEPDRLDVDAQGRARALLRLRPARLHREVARAARDARRAGGAPRALPRLEVDESGLTRTYQAHVRGFQNVPLVR